MPLLVLEIHAWAILALFAFSLWDIDARPPARRAGADHRVIYGLEFLGGQEREQARLALALFNGDYPFEVGDSQEKFPHRAEK